ncbi:MAG: molybdopterin converting factor subunit 1 [Ktedonobacterales bacterium]|nr:molybdopterin converting factor subunit 1 [Ktedonobacterales bacterium]
MRVTVRYFASLREAAGVGEEALALPMGGGVPEARALLVARHPALARLLPACAVAVNRAYAPTDAPLTEGDELAFIPPVGGG